MKSKRVRNPFRRRCKSCRRAIDYRLFVCDDCRRLGVSISKVTHSDVDISLRAARLPALIERAAAGLPLFGGCDSGR